jgi:FkbM family methyltransferase
MRYLDVANSVYDREGVLGILQSVSAYAQAKWRQATGQPVWSEGVLVPPHPRIGTLVLAQIIRERYENDECRLIREHVPDRSSIIDLGAGIGFTSAFAAQCVDDIQTHVAVEANPELIPVLQWTRELNECGFSIINAAYTTSGSSVKFERGHSLTRSSIYRSGEGSQTVSPVTLWELIDEYDLSEFVLVADIEGAEQELLSDEMDLLREHCPLVIVEFHRSVLGEDLSRWLDRMGDEYMLVADRDPVFAFVRDS